MKKLRVLYMSNNLVKEWAEFQKLVRDIALEDFLFLIRMHTGRTANTSGVSVHRKPFTRDVPGK